jgi:hypothetical protein
VRGIVILSAGSFYDLISKPQEGSTRVSLLGMLVTVLRGSAHSLPATVAAPGIFLPFASGERERASGRGGSFKDKLKRIWLQFAGARKRPWLVRWLSE